MKLMIALVLATSLAASVPALAQEAPPMVGGWSAGQTSDAEVKAAARFAVAQLGKGARLARIEAASQQVVAGMNYRLTLALRHGARWDVTVWRQLDGTMKLTAKNKLSHR